VLLGERDGVLAVAGSEAAPLVEEAPAPAEVAEASPPQPAAETQPASDAATAGSAEVTRSVSLSHPAQVGAYATLGVGAAALAVGIAMGVMSKGEAERLAGLPTAPDGARMGLTQREGDALNAQQRLHASLANGMFAAAGALAVASVALWVVGYRLSLTVAPDRLAVAGTFP
jgi:hypothetical protein